MRSKWIFWVIVFFITGSLITIGFLFFREEPMPFWVMQCIALGAIMLSVLLYKKLIKPYHLILNGMQLLKEQDFSTHLRKVKNDEANEIIDIFNRMISCLRNERLLVREKNQFLDLLIQASPQGILILNFNKQISEINPAGIRLLNIRDIGSVKGKTLEESDFELSDSLALMQPGDNIILRSSGVSLFRCIRSYFVDKGFKHPFFLIEELTHELLKVEKESYERIIRMMSHEVNNSIGAIGSTLNVVSDIFRQELKKEQLQDVISAVDASYDRSNHLAQFISDLANVVKIPEPYLSLVSLNELASSVDALTRMECLQRNIKFTLSLMDSDQSVNIDGILFEQVLVNIVKNAYEAIERNGEIKMTTFSSPLSISIEDNGPGLDEETKQKIFTPFFTTKSNGQGIGLMFVRDVLLKHHCKFSLATQDGWTRFEILFMDQ